MEFEEIRKRLLDKKVHCWDSLEGDFDFKIYEVDDYGESVHLIHDKEPEALSYNWFSRLWVKDVEAFLRGEKISYKDDKGSWSYQLIKEVRES